MRKIILLILTLLLIINSFAQDKKWNKIFNAYKSQNYKQALALSEKYTERKTSNPGVYYVIGLSYFKLYANSKNKFGPIKSAIHYIHTAQIKDRDSVYYRLFKNDLAQLRDSLETWSENYFQTNKQISKFYANSIIFLFKDTTQIYRKLYPPVVHKNNDVAANSIIPAGTQINQVDSRGRRQGLWIEKYPNGKPKYMIYFKNGKPAGVFRKYYPDGTLLVDMKFSPDGRRAEATFYDENGHKIAHGYYLDHKRDSLWQFFFNDSIPVKEVMYKNGKKNGFERIYAVFYYPNLLRERYYKNGVLDSVAVDYYYDGTPQRIMFYKNGKLNGPFQLFNYGGKIKIKGQYKNDYMEGLWYYFNSNGTVDTVRYHLGQNMNPAASQTESKIIKAMDEAKGKYPEPTQMFKKQFGLQGDW